MNLKSRKEQQQQQQNNNFQTLRTAASLSRSKRLSFNWLSKQISLTGISPMIFKTFKKSFKKSKKKYHAISLDCRVLVCHRTKMQRNLQQNNTCSCRRIAMQAKSRLLVLLFIAVILVLFHQSILALSFSNSPNLSNQWKSKFGADYYDKLDPPRHDLRYIHSS